LSTFAALFVPAPLRDAVSDAAWLAAMVDVERALAAASARARFVPEDAAAAIAAQCDPALYDIEQLCEDGRSVGNPAEAPARARRWRRCALGARGGDESGRHGQRGDARSA
jgi:3-carboxy-cis,cis-muconate cycloisomerase